VKKACIKVFGRVQGIFFRYHTRKLARKLGLLGFVENMPDGSVYIEAEGSDDKLNELIEFAKKGPPQARVDHVKVDYFESEGTFKGFEYKF
jgi:acylphosphatase